MRNTTVNGRPYRPLALLLFSSILANCGRSVCFSSRILGTGCISHGSTKMSVRQRRPRLASTKSSKSEVRVYDPLMEESEESRTNEINIPFNSKEKSVGLLTLFTVPLVWGTYVPTVRFMYESDLPMPGLVFSAAYLCVAAISSLAMLVAKRSATESANERDDSIAVAAKGGLELGLYTFLANSLQVVGLETVPSNRAGFLIQLTTVMVPIVQATLIDRNFLTIPRSTWIACITALAGVTIMGIDTDALLQNASLESFHFGFTRGDGLIVGAALLYTMHVVRLGHFAKQVTPLTLATAKSIVQSSLSISLIVSLYSATLGAQSSAMATGLFASAVTAGREITQFFVTFFTKLQYGELPLLSLGKIVGAIMWNGIVGTAYVLYAQSFGQRFVRPSDANLVYSLQPVFTAIFAYILLGETMEAKSFVGGALILGAVYLIASKTLATNDKTTVASH